MAVLTLKAAGFVDVDAGEIIRPGILENSFVSVYSRL